MILHDFLMNQRWRMPERYPDVSAKCTDAKFPDSRWRRGRRNTKVTAKVTDVRGVVEVVMLLPGRMAARVRSEAARILCRWLGGDLVIIDEVCAIRGFQEQLAVRAPEDPRRLFGEAVEAAPSAGSQLASLFAAVILCSCDIVILWLGRGKPQYHNIKLCCRKIEVQGVPHQTHRHQRLVITREAVAA